MRLKRLTLENFRGAANVGGPTAGGSFAELFRWFREREDVENEDRRDDPSHRDRQLEAVRAAVSGLMPGYSGLRVRRPRGDQAPGVDRPGLAIEKGGHTFTFSQLSEGERSLVAWLATLLDGSPSPTRRATLWRGRA